MTSFNKKGFAMMTKYPLWKYQVEKLKVAWQEEIHQTSNLIDTRIKVEIVSCGGGVDYTIRSKNTLLFLAAMFGLIKTGLALHVIGRELCCLWQPPYLPSPGETLVMCPHKDTWLTMAAGFCERGARATTTLRNQELHPDIKALLDACEHGKKIVLTVLDPRQC